MILPIIQLVNQRFIRQHKKAQIEKDVIFEKSTRIDHDYRVGDQIMVSKKDFKYKTPCKGPYDIVQTRKNGTVTIQTGVVPDILNIQRVKAYNSPKVD